MSPGQNNKKRQDFSGEKNGDIKAHADINT